MIENGMVLLGAQEWERMNADTPFDRADIGDFDRYIWDTDQVADMLIGEFGLGDGDLNEEIAKLIFDKLPAAYAANIVRKYVDSIDPEKYNAWKENN